MSEKMYRVRRISDGLYLKMSRNAYYTEIAFRWLDKKDWRSMRVTRFTRRKALAVATAMIALTGDHGIEIEPVEG